MDAVDLLRMMSSQAQHDIKVPKVKLGYIDHDFDLGSYPQELPRVLFDGEGLSSRGYVCLDSYHPVPGDRVVLLPQGTGYIIIGSINQRTSQTLDPGQVVLSINNHRPSGQQSFSNGVYLEWSDSLIYDPFGLWEASISPSGGTDLRSYITMALPGRFRIEAQVTFPSNATGYRQMEIHRNNTVERGARFTAADISGGFVRVKGSYVGNFTSLTDTIRIQCRTSGSVGSGQVFPNGADSSRLEIYYVGPKILDISSVLE